MEEPSRTEVQAQLCSDNLKELRKLVPDPAGRSEKHRRLDEVLFDAFFKLRGINLRDQIPPRDPNEEEGKSEARIKMLRNKICGNNARVAFAAFKDHIVNEQLGTEAERAKLSTSTIMNIIVDQVRRKVQNEPQVRFDPRLPQNQVPGPSGAPAPKRQRLEELHDWDELEFQPRNMENFGNAGLPVPPLNAQLQHQVPRHFQGQQKVPAQALFERPVPAVPPAPQQFQDAAHGQNQDPQFFGRVIKVPKHVQLPNRPPIILPEDYEAPDPSGPSQPVPHQFQGQHRVPAPALFERPAPAPQQFFGQQRVQAPALFERPNPQQLQGQQNQRNEVRKPFADPALMREFFQIQRTIQQQLNAGAISRHQRMNGIRALPGPLQVPQSIADREGHLKNRMEEIQGIRDVVQNRTDADVYMPAPFRRQPSQRDNPQQPIAQNYSPNPKPQDDAQPPVDPHGIHGQVNFVQGQNQGGAQNPAQQRMGGPDQFQMRAPDPPQRRAQDQGLVPANQRMSFEQVYDDRQAPIPMRRMPAQMNGLDQVQAELQAARQRNAERQIQRMQDLERLEEPVESDFLSSDMDF